MAPGIVGSDAPSTLGGTGWLPRTSSHTDELAEGRIWSPCGSDSEVADLRAVLLTWPPESLADRADPADRLMLDAVDLGAMRAQTEAVIEAYRSNGVHVHVMRPPAYAPPNVIFARDLLFMTRGGAILARMASAQRAGEERYAAEALARAGFPILATVAGTATFEGADALWLDSRTVAVGTGFRTNGRGLAAVRAVLRGSGVDVLEVPLGPGVQHLLGAFTPLDEGLAAIHATGATPPLRELLTRRGCRLIEFPADRELTIGRGMNLVALGPRRVLMPAGCPTIRRRLESAGVHATEVDVGEYLKAAGGLGCLTAILSRAPSGPRAAGPVDPAQPTKERP